MHSTLLSCRKFASLRNDSIVFSPIDLLVKTGECHQLLGQNGSGKTTCLMSFYGLKSHIGRLETVAPSYIGHKNGLRQQLTVRETIACWQQLNKNSILPQFAEMLPPELLVSSLSSGQKRILAWVRLIIEEKKLWLLDEPLTNIDKEIKQMLLKESVRHLNNHGAIIIVSHMNENWKKLVMFSHRIRPHHE